MTALEFFQLKKNNAVYHKSCKKFSSTTQLARAKQRVEEESRSAPSPKKTRKTGQAFDPKHCIFCDNTANTDNPLFRVSSENVSLRIITYAPILRDFKLLTKISGCCDLMAADATNHLHCYVAFKNKIR